MGEVKTHSPVLLIMAAFSRHDHALDWARDKAASVFGNCALESARFQFSDTPYYEREMGDRLLKTFFAFDELITPERLADIKLQTNDWESAYAAEFRHEEARPLNLDPGYLTRAKLVLATTKDRDHRIYLGHGIYAEGTLFFRGGQWCQREWTYPDYQRQEYHEFFHRCRDFLRDRLRSPTKHGLG